MTSMPLTLKSTGASCGVSVIFIACTYLERPGRPGSGPARTRSAFLRAVARLDLLLGGVPVCILLHERSNELGVRLIPVRNDLELGAVPLDDASPVVAHVVLAGRAHRTQDVVKAQFLQALFGQ